MTQMFLTCALIVSALAGPASETWRGIVPLHSTRADVEKLLGAPVAGERNVYKSGEDTVVITYAGGQCSYGWQVPLDTVISLQVQLKQGPRFADLKLDENKFEKRRDIHDVPIYYYVNQPQGTNYTVKDDVVTGIEYFPSAKDDRLRCATGPAAANQPADDVSASPGGATAKSKPTASAKIYQCPMHPKVTSKRHSFCPECGMRLVARRVTRTTKRTRPRQSEGVIKPASSSQTAEAEFTTKPWAMLTPAERLRETERLAPTFEYICPMHRDIHVAEPGVCPRCGMLLVSMNPSVRGDYKLSVTSTPLKPRPGSDVRLSFSVHHPETGERVTQYVLNHEKLLHLFIVSQDLAVYQHIHPQLNNDGAFSISTVLPRPGLYKLHADFFPVAGTPQVIHRDLATTGRKTIAKPVLNPDPTLTKVVDGMKITLDLGGVSLVPGNLIGLKYRLADAVTGEPVRDLQPYLGAWGHTLILNADQSEYLHSHPSEMLPAAGDRAGWRGGPEVEFKTIFPGRGPYRIWTQFQRAGKVTTVAFTLGIQ